EPSNALLDRRRGIELGVLLQSANEPLDDLAFLVPTFLAVQVEHLARWGDLQRDRRHVEVGPIHDDEGDLRGPLQVLTNQGSSAYGPLIHEPAPVDELD